MSGPNPLPVCPHCNVRPVIVRANGYPLPTCSECWHLIAPAAEAMPLGTVRVNARGYAKVKTETGWRFQHHVVAEQVLRRPLRDNEHVVWVDGDRSNNDPANLVLEITRSRPLLAARRRRGEKRSPRVQVNMDDELADVLAREAAACEGTPAQMARSLIHIGLVRMIERRRAVAS